MVASILSITSLRRPLSLVGERADTSTRDDVDPVSLAP
jgi:hypothetical protein